MHGGRHAETYRSGRGASLRVDERSGARIYRCFQSDTTQFLAFFIYGPDNKPTWYTAQLEQDAAGNYRGSLYATTGTYFANAWQGFNVVTAGTASFEPTDIYHATLRYSLSGGPAVARPVVRQKLTANPLAGTN